MCPGSQVGWPSPMAHDTAREVGTWLTFKINNDRPKSSSILARWIGGCFLMFFFGKVWGKWSPQHLLKYRKIHKHPKGLFLGAEGGFTFDTHGSSNWCQDRTHSKQLAMNQEDCGSHWLSFFCWCVWLRLADHPDQELIQGYQKEIKKRDQVMLLFFFAACFPHSFFCFLRGNFPTCRPL